MRRKSAFSGSSGASSGAASATTMMSSPRPADGGQRVAAREAQELADGPSVGGDGHQLYRMRGSSHA
jgi:hypothetical protein